MRCPIKVGVWLNYFKDLLNEYSDLQTQPLDNRLIKHVAEDMPGLDSEITVDEVRQLKGGKSVGSDNNRNG